MVKCKYCGEMNLEDGKYCARCGQELPSNDNTAMKDTLSKAQKSFDRDSLVTLERSRITYVCTVCGNINSIEQDRCDTCGKPRPRSEYVAALRKLKQSGRIQPEQQKPAPQPQTPIEEDVKLKEDTPVQAPIPVQASYPQVSGGQLPAAVQPFVVVPYVNTQQPLWQYRPNQVYRFQPYTQEEIEIMKEKQAAAQAQVQEVADRVAAEEKEKTEVAKFPGAKRVRVTAFLTLMIALGIVASMFLAPCTKSGNKASFYLFGIVDCFNEMGVLLGTVPTDYQYKGWQFFVPPVLLTVASILIVALIIRSIIRLITGKASVKGFVLPLFIFLTVAGALIGIVEQVLIEQGSGIASGELVAYFTEYADIGTYLIPALALVLVIVALFNKANVLTRRKIKKMEKEQEEE
ncbi:MAG: hypothetical protein ACOX24_00850 [Christensenellales bacterium]